MIIRNDFCDRPACVGQGCWRHICPVCGAYTVAHARSGEDTQRLLDERESGKAVVGPHVCGSFRGTSVTCLDRELMLDDWRAGSGSGFQPRLASDSS